jgi:NADPH2:quinone reductase
MSSSLMPAIVVRETRAEGGWNTLVLDQVGRPSPGPGEVLVQVEACSVNRADLLQRRGLYPPPPGASSILGLDFAGFVVETAPDVRGWNTGERVFGIVAGGGYGRYVASAADHLLAVPETLSFVEAAAAAEVFFTAFLNLFLEAGAQPGETLLVHGGGSGVGTAAIQLGVTAGLDVVFTAGSKEKIRRCLELGASHGIDYKEEDFAARTMEITENKGVDVVLDWIGAPYLSKHLDILKTSGRLVIIGLMGGNKSEIELAPVLTKRLRIIGSVLRSRSREEKSSITRAFDEQVSPLLASGQVKPVVDRIYPIRAAEEAHQYMKEGKHFGKIVLAW